MSQFLMRLRAGMARFMQGRHGPDNLSMFTLIAGLVISLASSFLSVPILSFLSLALYVITIFRMLSRNQEARLRENQKYIALTSNWKLKSSQAVKRLKNRKNYKYFRCPECKLLLRLSRGCGEKDITCVRCGHQFKKKA